MCNNYRHFCFFPNNCLFSDLQSIFPTDKQWQYFYIITRKAWRNQKASVIMANVITINISIGVQPRTAPLQTKLKTGGCFPFLTSLAASLNYPNISPRCQSLIFHDTIKISQSSMRYLSCSRQLGQFQFIQIWHNIIPGRLNDLRGCSPIISSPRALWFLRVPVPYLSFPSNAGISMHGILFYHNTNRSLLSCRRC